MEEFKLMWYDKKSLSKIVNRGKKQRLTRLPTEDEIFSMLSPSDELDDCDRNDKMRSDIKLFDINIINTFLKKLIDSNIVEDIELVNDTISKYKQIKMEKNMAKICEFRHHCINTICSYINNHSETVIEAIKICKMIYINYPLTSINTIVLLSISKMDIVKNYIPDNLEYENIIIDINNAYFAFAKIIIEYCDLNNGLISKHMEEFEEIDIINF